MTNTLQTTATALSNSPARLRIANGSKVPRRSNFSKRSPAQIATRGSMRSRPVIALPSGAAS